jgi:hypothetical protein
MRDHKMKDTSGQKVWYRIPADAWALHSPSIYSLVIPPPCVIRVLTMPGLTPVTSALASATLNSHTRAPVLELNCNHPTHEHNAWCNRPCVIGLVKKLQGDDVWMLRT